MNYKGSFCALITPFNEGKIDENSYKKIIDWHIESGTKGIVPCGTTGESPTLSHNEHKKIIELAVEYAAGRIPVIAGTGSNSTSEAMSLTKHAEEAGANSALVVVPYYNKPTQVGLKNHFLAIANSSNIPIFIYNIPGRSVVDMTIDTMAELAEHSNIIGVKDASNDVSRPQRLRNKIGNDNFIQFSGEDATQLGFLAHGGHGIISVTANVVPNLISEIQESWFEGNIKRAMELDRILLPLHDALFSESNPGPVKFAASKIGLCNYELRLPMTKISKHNESKVTKAMDDLNNNTN